MKIYEKVHKKNNSDDTGYASGLSSPWAVEDRSPLDYVTAVPRSPKPRSDTEAYEVTTSSSRPRYIKSSSERKKDAPPTAERRTNIRYVNRTPKSPSTEDDHVPGPSTETRKDISAGPRRTTVLLQRELAKGTKTVAFADEDDEDEDEDDDDHYDDPQMQQLEVELRKVRLERQLAEGRSIEEKPKRQQVEGLNRRERQLTQQLEDERTRRIGTMSPREAELAEKQWREIQAAPTVNPSLRRPANLVEHPTPKRPALKTSPESTALTTASRALSVLDIPNPFLAPILEAQQEDDARQAARAERRRVTAVKETGRSARQRPRNDDRHI